MVGSAVVDMLRVWREMSSEAVQRMLVWWGKDAGSKGCGHAWRRGRIWIEGSAGEGRVVEGEPW